jgi:hypothetical protein
MPLSTHPATFRAAAGALVGATAAAAIVALAPGWAGVVSALWLALVALAWRRPETAIAIAVLALSFEQRLALPTLVGEVTPMHYAGWALVAGMLPGLVACRRVVIDRVAIFNLAVVVALVASFGAGGVRVLTWWLEIATWLLIALVYICVRSLGLGSRGLRRVFLAIAAGVVVNALVAVWQVLTGAGPASFSVNGVVRAFGTFTHPNTFAAYLAIVLPSVFAMSMARPAGAGVWVIRAASIAGGAALLLTQSRGGWLAFATAMLVLVALAPRDMQRWAVAVGVSIAIVVVASGLFASVPGVERFTAIAGAGAEVQVTSETWGQLEREAHWGAARSMLTTDPLFGVGAAEFNDNFREHTPAWRFRVGRGDAHNAYLQLGAVAGLPGVIAYAAWVGCILVSLCRRAFRVTGERYLLVAGALGSAVAWAIDGIFEYQDVPAIPMLFVILVAIGLGGSMAPTTRSRIEAAPTFGAAS